MPEFRASPSLGPVSAGRCIGVGFTLLVVAALALTGCTREVSGSPVESQAMYSVDFDTVLLDADEIDDVMGSSDAEVSDEGDAPDDVTDVDPPECHGLVYIAGVVEYAPTDFTAMRWRTVGGEDVGVVEMVAQLPSAAKADEFIAEQSDAWQGCVDEVVTSKLKGGTETWRERTTAVNTHPGGVIASSIMLSTGQPCQHVLQAMANVILEVSACADDLADEAETIAAELADRVRAG